MKGEGRLEAGPSRFPAETVAEREDTILPLVERRATASL
jgi:hypothetical protein